MPDSDRLTRRLPNGREMIGVLAALLAIAVLAILGAKP